MAFHSSGNHLGALRAGKEDREQVNSISSFQTVPTVSCSDFAERNGTLDRCPSRRADSSGRSCIQPQHISVLKQCEKEVRIELVLQGRMYRELYRFRRLAWLLFTKSQGISNTDPSLTSSGNLKTNQFTTNRCNKRHPPSTESYEVNRFGWRRKASIIADRSEP